MKNAKNSVLNTYDWNASLGGDFLWSNTNFGEAVTDVMTPLTWSVIQFTLADWVYVPGIATVGNIGGYPYLNISVFMTVFQALGKNRQDLLKTMEGTLYMNLPEEIEIPAIPITRRRSISMFQHLLRMRLKQKQGQKRLPAYLSNNPKWFLQTKEQLQRERTNPGLLALWHGQIRAHIQQGVWTVLGVALPSTEYTTRLRQKLEAMVGFENANLLIANMSSRAELLPSLGLVIGQTQVAGGKISYGEYLQQYGHRGPHEFELSVPRPSEDPGWLDAQIARFRASPVDFQIMQEKQKAALDQAWESLASQYPGQAKSIHSQLEQSARLAMQREQARSEYVRDRWLIRLFALQAAALNDLGDDIFFLTLDEMLGYLAGDKTATNQITRRQKLYQHFQGLPPLPSIIRGHFDPFQWVGSSGPRGDIYEEHPTPNRQTVSSTILKGAPGSAGQVEGIVRVIDRHELGEALQNGEILVAVQTDIAWTLLFPRAAAVVTDVGAPLSHAAIVARELGIPAVVGCGDATKRLKTGDRVRVDGSRGVVEVLENGSG